METIQPQNLIPASISSTLPSMVRTEVSKLPADKQTHFLEEYKRRMRSLGVAYLFAILLGAHYGYLKKWGMQIVFWLTWGGFMLWWIIDLVRMSSMVNDYNKDIAVDVLRDLKSIS